MLAKKQKEIMELVAGEVQLRSKKLLIEKFINENLATIQLNADLITQFKAFWTTEKQQAFTNLC
jgi:type I restriction enzyme R subunit